MLSQIAAALYVLVCLATFAAFLTARNLRQRKLHGQVWIALVVLFAALAILRYFAVEEWAREWARDILRASDSYASRREFQGPIAAGLILIFVPLALYWFRKAAKAVTGRREWAVFTSAAAGLAMIFLIAIRLVSFSLVDRLLYGPLKLNWIGDIGLSFAVVFAAIYYVRTVRRKSATD